MKNSIKTIALASVLAVGAMAPANAAFVKPVITYTAAATTAKAVALPADAKTASTATTSILPGTRAENQKGGFFYRLSKRLQTAAGKSQLVALLLTGLIVGIHRFYLGYTWQGVVQLLTFGGLGIWTLIDWVRILVGSLQPKDGSYDSGWSL